MHTHRKELSWRDFQAEYIKQGKPQGRRSIVVKRAVGLLAACFIIFFIGFQAVSYFTSGTDRTGKEKIATPSKPELPQKKYISKTRLSEIIHSTPFVRTDKNIFFIDTPGENYKVTTSIDIYLQEYLLGVMKQLKKRTRGKPQRIAIVAMESDTGKILAMTGFDLDDPDTNPCIESDYPAASIIKIVTAAAAVETLGYKPYTQLYFNGNKYTLYKRQLRDVKNKYTYKISFSRAFAESINPVFGKIGKNYLGKERLDTYAEAFGFNQQIDAEIPFTSGSFETTDSEYHLAELGCGFNNNTTISPLFGAMLTSAVINSGNVMLPSIVEHVTDSDGEIIYKNTKSTYKTAMRPETAETMVALMKKTITSGTARKTFRGASRDAVLSKLVIGGKTGSLYNKEHTVKYDWFTGFGEEKNGGRKISLAIVVGHRKYIGTRAAAYAKMILKQYFKENDPVTAQL